MGKCCDAGWPIAGQVGRVGAGCGGYLRVYLERIYPAMSERCRDALDATLRLLGHSQHAGH